MRLKVYAMDSSKVEGIIRDYSLRGYYPTAVCRVFNARETLCRFAVGDATPDSWFDLASVSKIVCATMIFFLMTSMQILIMRMNTEKKKNMNAKKQKDETLLVKYLTS